jgi:hypothetical protein
MSRYVRVSTGGLQFITDDSPFNEESAGHAESPRVCGREQRRSGPVRSSVRPRTRVDHSGTFETRRGGPGPRLEASTCEVSTQFGWPHNGDLSASVYVRLTHDPKFQISDGR